MLITEILRQNARLFAQESALISIPAADQSTSANNACSDIRREITWQEFDEQANQVANYYNSIGIGRGNKIGIIMMNCLEWLPIYFGVMRSGAVVVPLNYRYQAKDIIRSSHFVKLDALIFDEKSMAEVVGGLTELSRIRSFIFVGPKEHCPPFASLYSGTFGLSPVSDPGNQILAGDDAAIYFSSGTTGVPKAVVYTHRTLELACLQEQRNHEQVKKDCFILIPPLYHVGAKIHWLGNLLTGARCVLLLGFNVKSFFRVVSEEKVTLAFLLLPWVQDIFLAIDDKNLSLESYDLSSLRMIHLGAQPIPPCVVRRLMELFPSLDFDISYGLTESGGPGCLDLGKKNLNKIGSVGRPTAGWRAKIVDENGNETKTGTPGELLLKGEGIMNRYFGDVESTARAITDGWLRTGDIAVKDNDDFYSIVDRKKNIIISGGENIYPVPIEDFIREHALVKDAAVFGISSRRLGEAAIAVVELVPGAVCTEAEMKTFCLGLPRFERPKRFYFGEIPRNPTGKIDKVALRNRYSNEKL